MTTRMIETNNGLAPKIRRQMVELLDLRLADALDLYSHAKHAHWNVRGARFFFLHELFDKVAELAQAHADELAERAGQLGGEVHGTLRQGAQATTLPEYPHGIASGEDHVQALSVSLAAFGNNVRQAIDTADKAGDADTADIFTEISRATDKMLWFVESHQVAEMPTSLAGKKAEMAMASAKA